MVDRKWTFFDHLPTSYCKRSLWTTPYEYSCLLRPNKLIDDDLTLKFLDDFEV